MIQKYMKVSLFEISYKKKWTFSQYSISFKCTCVLLISTFVCLSLKLNGCTQYYPTSICVHDTLTLSVQNTAIPVDWKHTKSEAWTRHTWISVFSTGIQSIWVCRAARLIKCNCHAHLVSKAGSVISSKSPSPAFRWSSIHYTEP